MRERVFDTHTHTHPHTHTHTQRVKVPSVRHIHCPISRPTVSCSRMPCTFSQDVGEKQGTQKKQKGDQTSVSDLRLDTRVLYTILKPTTSGVKGPDLTEIH